MLAADRGVIDKDVAEVFEPSDEVELLLPDGQFPEKIALLDDLEEVVIEGQSTPLGRVVIICREDHFIIDL